MKQSITNSLFKTLTPQLKPYEIRDTTLTGLILRVQPTGSTTYYCEYARGKRIKLGSGNALTPYQAREMARQTIADVLQGDDPIEAKRKARQHTLESYLMEVYSPWAKGHIKTHDARMKMMRATFPELLPLPLGEVTQWVVDKWKANQLKHGLKGTSVNRMLSDLRSALNKAVEWGHLTEHPLSKLKPCKVDNNAKVRYLSDEEEARLRKALIDREARHRQERDNANKWRTVRRYPTLKTLSPFEYKDYLTPLVILAINTGLRRGELFNLTWEDINLKTRLLTVDGDDAKSGKTRHVYLNDEALSVLQKWQMTHKLDRGLVFPNEDGKRLDNVRKSWGGVLKAAKILNFRFHDMRHHFASRLVMEGVDLNTVRELLGHSDYKMTLV